MQIVSSEIHVGYLLCQVAIGFGRIISFSGKKRGSPPIAKEAEKESRHQRQRLCSRRGNRGAKGAPHHPLQKRSTVHVRGPQAPARGRSGELLVGTVRTLTVIGSERTIGLP